MLYILYLMLLSEPIQIPQPENQNIYFKNLSPYKQKTNYFQKNEFFIYQKTPYLITKKHKNSN